ncbi:hypothetical protein BHM03_00015556 [Ensete ventricosum]|nr:hypothetical protein BHM03_00015556 [Ensete ventricosum]
MVDQIPNPSVSPPQFHAPRLRLADHAAVIETIAFAGLKGAIPAPKRETAEQRTRGGKRVPVADYEATATSGTRARCFAREHRTGVSRHWEASKYAHEHVVGYRSSLGSANPANGATILLTPDISTAINIGTCQNPSRPT